MTLGFETYDEPEGFYLRDTAAARASVPSRPTRRASVRVGTADSLPARSDGQRDTRMMRGSTCSATCRCGPTSSSFISMASPST